MKKIKLSASVHLALYQLEFGDLLFCLSVGPRRDDPGYGLLSAVWAGFGLTLLGLLVFALTLPKAPQFAPA